MAYQATWSTIDAVADPLKKVRITGLDASMKGATVSVVVWEVPTGGNVVGNVIGQFLTQQISSALGVDNSAYVEISIGTSSYTLNTAVKAVIGNASFTTGLVDGIILAAN